MDIATAHYGPAMLERGGPAARARRVHAAGADVTIAAVTAAKQGKGHIAELSQALSFEVDAALRASPFDARPSPLANDSKADLEVLFGDERVRGPQVKVGSLKYVRRAIRSKKYDDLIIDGDAYQALSGELNVAGQQMADRLEHDRVAASQLVANECNEQAVEVLERMLEGHPAVGAVRLLTRSFGAGARDGLIVFAGDLAWGVVKKVIDRQNIDFAELLQGAARKGCRAVAKTTVQTGMLLSEFLGQAREIFEHRLVRRIAGSTVAVGVIAEVIVEAAIDVIAVVRGELAPDLLLPRVGVHALTAVGGGAAVALVLTATRGAPWWFTALLAAGLGVLGAKAGRALGEALFIPPAAGDRVAV